MAEPTDLDHGFSSTGACNMKKLYVSTAMILGLAVATYATAASADEFIGNESCARRDHQGFATTSDL